MLWCVMRYDRVVSMCAYRVCPKPAGRAGFVDRMPSRFLRFERLVCKREGHGSAMETRERQSGAMATRTLRYGSSLTSCAIQAWFVVRILGARYHILITFKQQNHAAAKRLMAALSYTCVVFPGVPASSASASCTIACANVKHDSDGMSLLARLSSSLGGPVTRYRCDWCIL